MDDGVYDLHVLPPNPTPKQKDNPLVIENMTNDATVEFLKRVIAKKLNYNAWRDIKLYFSGEEMIDSEKLGLRELADKDVVTAVSAVDVSRPPKPETKKTSEVKGTAKEGPRSEAKGRMLDNLAFKFGSRTLNVYRVDLSTTFGKLRERVAEENNLGGFDLYFVFGTKKLEDYQQLETYGLHENSTVFIMERVHGGVKCY